MEHAGLDGGFVLIIDPRAGEHHPLPLSTPMSCPIDIDSRPVSWISSWERRYNAVPDYAPVRARACVCVCARIHACVPVHAYARSRACPRACVRAGAPARACTRPETRTYSPHFRLVKFSGNFYQIGNFYLERSALKSLCFQQLASKIGFGTALATVQCVRTAATKRQADGKEFFDNPERFGGLQALPMSGY